MKPAPILPLDEAARHTARTELARSFLVEAGAGTGKTSLIVERIANLVDGGVPLDRIVAITFTEKAAGELKIRVRQTLEGRASTSAKARAALAILERASISTIHAWCASLLRAYPVEAAVDPLFTVLDAPASTSLFDRCWEDWLGRELSNAGSGRIPLVDLPGFTADWWIGKLQGLARFLVDKRDRLPGALPEDLEGNPSERLVQAFARTDFGAYSDSAIAPGDAMLEMIQKSRYAKEAFLRMQPEAQEAALLGQQTLAIPLKNSYGRVGNKLHWKGRETQLDAARTDLESLAREAQAARARAAHRLCTRFARWLSDPKTGFVKHYEDEKARTGALDFDDLLVKVACLLRGHPAVRKEIRRGVKALILDEFQDTDPVQCEAAFLLTSENDTDDWRKARPRPGALFLVGDPKQSIYSFRGADIETYSDARERLAEAGSLLPISTNFRSRENVLAWVNAVFAQLIVAPADGGRWQTGYVPLDHARPAGGNGTGVHVVRPPEGAEYLHVGQSRDAESRAVAALLRDQALGMWTVRDRKSGEDRVAGYGDMVVLLRNRTSSLPAFERAFRAAGIPYVVVGGRALWERQEVRALTALCRAVENPFDQVSLIAALKSPFFGASDAHLLLWKHRHGGFAAPAARAEIKGPDDEGPIAEALLRIRAWHEARLEMPPYRLLERILGETGALAAFGMKPDGAQRVANLLRLVESARDTGDAFGLPGAPPSFRAFVHGLAERVREIREEAEGAVVEENDNAVRILTMHAAKGLEYPIVVLGDLAVTENRHRNTTHVDPATSTFAFRLGSQELGMETMAYEEVRVQLERREEAEDLRLLYVAATRACDALVVPLFATTKGKKPGIFYRELTSRFPALLGLPAGATLAAGEGGPARVVEHLVPIVGDPPVFRVPIAELEEALDRALRAGRGSAAVMPLAIAAGLAERGVARRVGAVTRVLAQAYHADPNAKVKSLLTSNDAKAVGVCVHAALEIADLDDAEGIVRAARAEAVAQGLSPAAAAHAEAMAKNAAHLPSLARALKSPRLLREWPFVLKGNDGWLLEGVVDLAWVEDGELVVFDYKTDTLDGTESGLAAAGLHHRTQLMAYALAMQTITGLRVREVILGFLAGPSEVVFPVAASDLDSARAGIAVALRQ